VERSPIVSRTDLKRTVMLVAAVVVALFAVALVVGMALSALPFPWGPVVALVLVALVACLVLPELRSVWAGLPR
jgi:hypothetical protein